MYVWKYLAAAAVCVVSTPWAVAHDTWLQSNTNIVRTGDVIHIDLMLGNHGNQHRDFKLASKASLKHSTLTIVTPDGSTLDLRDRMVDVGYAPNEGFWSGRFVASASGLYVAAHTLDQVMTYAPVRAVKSAKVCFVASDSLDRVAPADGGFDRVFGHPLELVPTVNPAVPIGPEQPLAVQLLYQGKPLADTVVSFIPRSQPLSEGFDSTYERRTDAEGRAQFTPKFGDYYLVVAHHEDPQAAGDGYEKTKYSAALTVFVPQTCTCCVE